MTGAEMGMRVYFTLARTRKSGGVTQRDVADAMGISVYHFNRIENGHKTATADQIFAWAERVGCTISISISQ